MHFDDFMIFYFFITYFLRVNKTNYNTIIDQSYKIPAFLLIFSPHCPHCTAVHPSWEELMKKYEADKKIIIAECNAIENRQECKSLFKYTGYPTFVIISRGRSKSISPQRTIESFINETERLKKIDYSVSCASFQTEFDQNYPAFVLSNGKTVVEKCNQLQKIINIYPQVKSHLYINSTDSEIESFVAITSQGKNITYNGKEEIQSLIDFMKELIMVPFGEWNYSDASSIDKRIGLLIHSTHSQYLSFSKIIMPYSDIFSLCKIDSGYFSKIFPKYKIGSINLPFFAISNKKKTKFFIFENVLKDQKFLGKLNKTEKGEFDNDAKYDLSALFPILDEKKQAYRSKIINKDDIEKESEEKENNEKQIKQENDIKNIKNQSEKEKLSNNLEDKNQNEKVKNDKFASKLATPNFKIFISITILLSFLAVFVTMYFLKNTTSKIE